MDTPQPSGWRKTHTWVFSGIGTTIISIIVVAFMARNSSESGHDASRPTPTGVTSAIPQDSTSWTAPTVSAPVEPPPRVAETKAALDTARRHAEEERAERLRAEIQRLEEQREEGVRAETRRLEERRVAQARAENERLERQREELRRQEERARGEAANTWHLARVRNRSRVMVSYSVLSDAGEWRSYTVAPGATAGHARHGDVVIEFDRGGGRGTNRMTLNSSTVRAARPSKADQDSAPASYFGARSDGSLIINPR
jgi:hypothetical protein